MRGLIIKDLLNLKKQGKILVFIILVYSIITIASDDNNFFAAAIAMIFAFIPMTTFAFDEQVKWDKYALTMPVSRKEMVLSKYVLGLISSAVALLINLFFLTISGIGFTKDSMLSALAILCVGLIFVTISLPIVFKMGVEKARLFIMLVIFTPTGLVVLLSKWGVQMPSSQSIENLIYFAPLVVVTCFWVSIFASIRIYQRKEM